MKLFMWTKDVLRDHTSGMAFAVAETEEEARRLVREEVEGVPVNEDDPSDFDGPPDEVREVNVPSAYFKWGGM